MKNIEYIYDLSSSISFEKLTSSQKDFVLKYITENEYKEMYALEKNIHEIRIYTDENLEINTQIKKNVFEHFKVYHKNKTTWSSKLSELIFFKIPVYQHAFLLLIAMFFFKTYFHNISSPNLVQPPKIVFKTIHDTIKVVQNSVQIIEKISIKKQIQKYDLTENQEKNNTYFFGEQLPKITVLDSNTNFGISYNEDSLVKKFALGIQ